MFRRRKKAETPFKLHMPWRENLETLSAAIVMALVLKYFVVEAYKIPTGSMQPTLMGDDGTQIYDRILVDKFSFVVRDPERWEVVVFKYPLDLVKNYVKRLVGMPGEKLAVADGNLWAATDPAAHDGSPMGTWKILRKPVEVQRDLWKELWSWEGGAKEKEPERKIDNNEDGSNYRLEVVDGSWLLDNGAMRTDGGQPFRFHWPSESSVKDYYYDGYPDALTKGPQKVQPPGRGSPQPWIGKNQVGDLRLDVELTPDADVAEVELTIRAYQRVHRFRIAGPKGEGESYVLWNAKRKTIGEVNPRRPFEHRLAAGESVELRAEACDQRLRLTIDGEEVARVEYDLSWARSRGDDVPPQDLAPEVNADYVCRVELAVRGTARVTSLRVFRDIHYLPEQSKASSSVDWANDFSVLHPKGECTPADSYYMMGDNTQNSLDSRGWKQVRADRLDGAGKASGNFNPMPSSPDTNPRPVRSEVLEGVEVMRTVTGRDVLVKQSPATPHPPFAADTHFAPYVRRDLIVGKAVVVFWPIWPASAMRWKFVR